MVSGYLDVDVVLMIREFVRMIKEVGIDFVNLLDSYFDDLMGDVIGVGVIFGIIGGVMEVVLWIVYEVLIGKIFENVEII